MRQAVSESSLNRSSIDQEKRRDRFSVLLAISAVANRICFPFPPGIGQSAVADCIVKKSKGAHPSDAGCFREQVSRSGALIPFLASSFEEISGASRRTSFASPPNTFTAQVMRFHSWFSSESVPARRKIDNCVSHFGQATFFLSRSSEIGAL